MTRRRSIALAVAAVLVAVGLFAWLNRPRDQPTRTSVGDAVSSFRHEDAAGAHAGGPPRGVYSYATRGGESAETPLLDASHDYRGVSTIVVGTGACGELEHWQVLVERWTEAETCPAGGDRLTAVREYHEFFGVEKRDSFRCGADSAGDPSLERPGSRFSSSCRSSDSTVASHSRFLGFGRIPVGGQTFAAAHIVTDNRLEGASSGSSRLQDWRRRSDGLLLRRSAQTILDTDTAGGTHYAESYTLRLLSSRPKR
jgi:hypothetical protein